MMKLWRYLLDTVTDLIGIPAFIRITIQHVPDQADKPIYINFCIVVNQPARIDNDYQQMNTVLYIILMENFFDVWYFMENLVLAN